MEKRRSDCLRIWFIGRYLIGADLVRIGDILTYQPTGFAFASIGGAGVFDAIFLVGVLAVTIDVIFVENVRLINWIQRRLA